MHECVPCGPVVALVVPVGVVVVCGVVGGVVVVSCLVLVVLVVVLLILLPQQKSRAKLSPRALALHTSAPGKVTTSARPFRTFQKVLVQYY